MMALLIERMVPFRCYVRSMHIEYESYDAVALSQLVASGEVTAEELLDAALLRIARLNETLNAVTLIQEDVARQQIRSGLPDGPLRGVPFLLKDLGAEAIDFPSHNGSALLANTRHKGDSVLYTRLAQAGLVNFGRTTAPEGGIGPVTEARIYGGSTRNPWNTDRTPGGSSGGAAAAVAAGILPAAHGSDGGGSIRIPASSCGLFGFKATRGRLPDGPFSGEGWAGMAIDGFLTRSVRDSAVLLDATQGADLGAPYTAPPLQAGFLASTQQPPRRLRIGYSTTTLTGAAIHADCQEAVIRSAALLRDLGHHVEESMPVADTEDMHRAWTTIVACGTSLWVNRALAEAGRELSTDDVEAVARGAREYASNIRGEDYLDAINRIHRFGRQMAAWFENYDIFLSATLAEPPARIGRFAHVREDFEGYRLDENGVFAYSPFTAIFNASGQPAASLPLHWNTDGLPIGVQLAAAFGEDELLMSLSSEIETASPWFQRRPPCRMMTNDSMQA